MCTERGSASDIVSHNSSFIEGVARKGAEGGRQTVGGPSGCTSKPLHTPTHTHTHTRTCWRHVVKVISVSAQPISLFAQMFQWPENYILLFVQWEIAMHTDRQSHTPHTHTQTSTHKDRHTHTHKQTYAGTNDWPLFIIVVAVAVEVVVAVVVVVSAVVFVVVAAAVAIADLWIIKICASPKKYALLFVSPLCDIINSTCQRKTSIDVTRRAHTL